MEALSSILGAFERHALDGIALQYALSTNNHWEP